MLNHDLISATDFGPAGYVQRRRCRHLEVRTIWKIGLTSCPLNVCHRRGPRIRQIIADDKPGRESKYIVFDFLENLLALLGVQVQNGPHHHGAVRWRRNDLSRYCGHSRRYLACATQVFVGPEVKKDCNSCFLRTYSIKYFALSF